MTDQEGRLFFQQVFASFLSGLAIYILLSRIAPSQTIIYETAQGRVVIDRSKREVRGEARW